MILPSRRSLITGLASLVAAPAIVRASSLMPVKALQDGPSCLHPGAEIEEYLTQYYEALAPAYARTIEVVRDPSDPTRLLVAYEGFPGLREIVVQTFPDIDFS